MENPGQRNYEVLILADTDKLPSKIVGVNISTNNTFRFYIYGCVCVSVCIFLCVYLYVFLFVVYI